MNLKTTMAIVALSLFFCLGGVVQASEKLDQKDVQILTMEFQNLQLQNQIMQTTFEKNNKRLQELATILKPYLSDTTGAKAPAKAAKKK